MTPEPAHRIAIRIARRACSGRYGEGQIAFEIEESIREARSARIAEHTHEGKTAMKDLELLGLKVRDRVTGLTGIVSSVCFDLYGCVQGIVSPPVDEKGALPDGKWIDTSRLEVLDPVPVMEIPGGRFVVTRSSAPAPSTDRPGPTEKPAR